MANQQKKRTRHIWIMLLLTIIVMMLAMILYKVNCIHKTIESMNRRLPVKFDIYVNDEKATKGTETNRYISKAEEEQINNGRFYR